MAITDMNVPQLETRLLELDVEDCTTSVSFALLDLDQLANDRKRADLYLQAAKIRRQRAECQLQLTRIKQQ